MAFVHGWVSKYRLLHSWRGLFYVICRQYCFQHSLLTPLLNAYMKYNWLAFLSRLAFICNLCFLVIFITQLTYNFLASWHNIIGTIAILGFSSLIISAILQAILAVRRITNKPIPVKAWLRIANLVFFIMELWYFFYLQGR